MKKYLGILCLLIFVFTLALCGTDFDGSRTGNDSEFIMDYKVLNTTVYEGKDVSFSDEFDVEIEESGTYIVTVTGEKARGSVSFTVKTNQ